MTEGFHRRRGGGAVATLNAFEADLLRSLAAQMVELLLGDAPARTVPTDPLEALLDFSGPVEPPGDPVLARLLPSAYRDDDEAAAEFRRFTENDLRTGKAGGATTILDALVEAGLPDDVSSAYDAGITLDLELDPAQGLTWLKSLTDLRLAMAVRLGVDDDDDLAGLRLEDDDPRAHLIDIYDWLGFLQETLVRSLSR